MAFYDHLYYIVKQIIGSKQKVLTLGTELLAWNSSPNVGQRPRGVTLNRKYNSNFNKLSTFKCCTPLHLHTPTLARNLTNTSAQSRSLLLLLQNAPYTIFCIVLLSKSERNPAILKCTLYCILFYSYQKVREILLS